jgi:N-glycosylase/DNA lyase
VSETLFTLPLDQPLDLTSTLASGQCFRWRADDAERWVGVIDRDVVRLGMSDGGLTIESSPTPAIEMVEPVAGYLRLDDDLLAIQSRIGSDPRVQEGIDRYPGLRVLRQDPWETLAGFILSSTSNIGRISRTVELLAETFGAPVTLGDVTRQTFPTPGELAEAGEARLRELGCGFRAPYLQGAAEAVAAGQLPLGQLRGAPYADALASLTGLHGVGDKIADCAMLFSLDHMEAFPADRWVRKVVVEWYGMAANLSYDGVRQWAWERFGQDAGYANEYLFWNVRQSERANRAPK